MNTNLAKQMLEDGGSIIPLLVDSTHTNGTGLCNPSILVYNGFLVVNLRHVGYNLYHSEYNQKYSSWHGPLIYLHPEDDLTLRTENYIGAFNAESLEPLMPFTKVDMVLNKEPKWEFIGLEDVRLTNWGGELNLIGVRRDTTTNGEGRIEISTITPNTLTEYCRTRIEPPGPSYCEKNWMPIIDKPYHFVKWTNPTEVVKIDYSKGLGDKNAQAVTISTNPIKVSTTLTRDLRGGSQVIPFEDGYIAITHEVDLWKHEDYAKDAHYYHRFVIWDKDFNLVKVSNEFKFFNARVEFVAGLAYLNNHFYITLGFQDNVAFLIKVKEETVKNFIDEK